MPAFLPLFTTFSHIIQLFYMKKQVGLSDLLLPLMSYSRARAERSERLSNAVEAFLMKQNL